ncbi:MAG TPA: hypothetical protein VFV36_09915, partial [Candidatus Methylomirabilis sp.]|nr:hypothetical protein [Candidatus Methylomirabilis sp.]
MISFVASCTALVASIFGPLVTLTVARRQFAASVLSANRQRWIESLRDSIAEFISLLITAVVVKARWKEKWDKGRSVLAAEPALMHKVGRMVFVQSKIRLLMNPTEADHQQLFAAIDRAIKRLQSEEVQEAETEQD